MRAILVSAAALAAAVAGPVQAQSTLAAGQTIQGRLDRQDRVLGDNTYFECFRLQGGVGQLLTIDLRSDDFDAYLSTASSCAPEAASLDFDDDSGGDLNARLEIAMGSQPLYVRANTVAPGETGAFTLTAIVRRNIPALAAACDDPEMASREAAIRACGQLAADGGLATPMRAQALVKRAGWRFEGGDRAAAMTDLSEAAALDPNNSDVYLMRGQIHARGGDAASALADYDKALQMSPRNAQVYIRRAEVHEFLGDSTRASADVEEALRLAPDLGDAWALRAWLRARQGQFRGAIADYSEAIQRNPAPAEWYLQRGNAYWSEQDLTGALADYDEAVRRAPGLANAWYARARLYEAQGDQTRALAGYDEALRLTPDGDLALARRGSLLSDMKLHDRAIADVDRAASLAPDNADHQNLRCWFRAVADRDLETARRACDRSLALKPDRAFVLDSRALVAFRQGRFGDAWADYDAAHRLEADDAGYLYGRGLSALKLGRTAEGQADIVAALALDPEVARPYADRGLRP